MYKYKPTNKSELIRFIKKEIRLQGLNADLSCINTSLITDMGELFKGTKFNGDVSNWNTGNVFNMSAMFESSLFNGDISRWNTYQE